MSHWILRVTGSVLSVNLSCSQSWVTWPLPRLSPTPTCLVTSDRWRSTATWPRWSTSRQSTTRVTRTLPTGWRGWDTSRDWRTRCWRRWRRMKNLQVLYTTLQVKHYHWNLHRLFQPFLFRICMKCKINFTVIWKKIKSVIFRNVYFICLIFIYELLALLL